MVKFGVVQGPSEGARQVPRPLPPPYPRRGEIWVVRGLSSDHSGLGSTPKLNFSVIVTTACAADMETEVLVARGATERGLPPLVGQVSVGSGQFP